MPFDSGFQPDPVAHLIQCAASIIAFPEDWCQGTLSMNGRHCALGALTAAAFGDGDCSHLVTNMAMAINTESVPPRHLRQKVRVYQQAFAHLNAAAMRRAYSSMIDLNDRRRFFHSGRVRQHRLVLEAMHEAASYSTLPNYSRLGE